MLFSFHNDQNSVIADNILDILISDEKLLNLAQESGIDCRKVNSLLRQIKEYHPEVFQHSLNVARLSALLSRKLKLSAIEIYIISIGALLHDLGKIFLPRSILDKKGKLTPDEYMLVKSHPQIGANMVFTLDSREQLKPILLLHHERLDKKGYYAISKYNIPLSTRIITLADAFDAMTSPRPYQKQKNLSECWMEIEKCSGTQFDPELLPDFYSVVKDINNVR